MRKFMRVMFSRYALSALLILADLLLIGFMISYAYSYSWIFVFFSVLVDVAVIISIINRDTNPEFKLTWITVVLLMPIFGGVLYILFHNRRLRPKEIKFLREMGERMREHDSACGENEKALRVLNELSGVSKSAAGKALSIMSEDEFAHVYRGCVSAYYDTGEAMFESMLREIEKAERFILLEYFIIEDGVMWQRLKSVLLKKVSEGVTVRMLYDDIGCMKTLPANFAKALVAKGIECYRFAKVTPKLDSSHNNRDHRKILVVDGKVAFTGGINIADEYINKVERFGHWKDGGIKVEGAAARGFTRLFLSLFDLTARSFSNYDFFLPASEKSASKENEGGGFVIPFGSGPAPLYPAPVGKNILMNIINTAERYIFITTPYLIIDYDLTEALRSAAKRGVDVRLITPKIPDKKIIKIMTKSSYPYLLAGGVRVFEYTPGFIHEKCIVSDDAYSMVGTINMDYRSLVHHFEDGLWLFKDPVITDIRDSFMKTESVSEEMLASECRLSFTQKIIRDLIRIFAPLL